MKIYSVFVAGGIGYTVNSHEAKYNYIITVKGHLVTSTTLERDFARHVLAVL